MSNKKNKKTWSISGSQAETQSGKAATVNMKDLVSKVDKIIRKEIKKRP
jgi:hypothetical protein